MPRENANLTFKRNWYNRLPHHICLDGVPEEDRAILEQADDRMPKNVLTMDEARDFLIVDGGNIRTDTAAEEFRAALNRLFQGTSSAASVDCLDPALPKVSSEIAYFQWNNPNDADLKEAKDLRQHVADDSDKPKLRRFNQTAKFNALSFEEFTAYYEQSMRDYFDDLISRNSRMGGYVISGHSNGRDMLQELEHHRYRSKLRPRDVLTKLRNENADYRRLMDTCEKVGLLGCFHGGAKEEWGQIFPNAVIVGTQQFAPSSWSGASAEIYNMASRAEELFEKDWRTTADKAVGETKRGMWKTELGSRGVTMRVPGNIDLHEARRMLSTAKSAFDSKKSTIQGILADPHSYEQPKLDQAYSVTNSYLQAKEQLWVLSGREEGAEADAIRALDYVKDDLFAIRKHYPERPSVPAGVNPELAFA